MRGRYRGRVEGVNREAPGRTVPKAGLLVAVAVTLMAIRRGDRSAILVLPLIAFLFAFTFIVGEFAVPH